MFLLTKKGFSLIEAVIAVSIFLILFLGANALLQQLVVSHVGVYKTFQSQHLANNGLKITESWLKDQGSTFRNLFTSLSTYAPASFQLRWNGDYHETVQPDIESADDAELVSWYQTLSKRYFFTLPFLDFQALLEEEKRSYLLEEMEKNAMYDLIPNIPVLINTTDFGNLIIIFRFIDAFFPLPIDEVAFLAMNEDDARSVLRTYWATFRDPIDTEFESSITIHSNQGGDFLRKIRITRLEDWGLFEIESMVCYSTCDMPYYVYSITSL